MMCVFRQLNLGLAKSVHAFTPKTPYAYCIGGACPRGQTVVVTGADGGIGSEFCRHYASSGAQVFACRYVWNIHVRMYLQEGSLDPVLASFLVIARPLIAHTAPTSRLAGPALELVRCAGRHFKKTE